MKFIRAYKQFCILSEEFCNSSEELSSISLINVNNIQEVFFNRLEDSDSNKERILLRVVEKPTTNSYRRLETKEKTYIYLGIYEEFADKLGYMPKEKAALVFKELERILI